MEDMLLGFDHIRTIMQNLPPSIAGYTIKTDDFYTIVLNENLSRERNIDSFYHELKHITENDFDKTSHVNEIEDIAHK